MAEPSKTAAKVEMKKPNLRNFDQSLPMSLLRAREAVMRRFTPFLRERNLSPEQWRVIRALELEDGLELAELSKRCFLLAPSLTRIARNLEDRNLVSRKHVESDQRRARLFLTDDGLTLFKDVAPESLEQYARISERFSDQKLTLLYELLDELVDSLDDSKK